MSLAGDEDAAIAPTYAVPAVEKALDVLECLASTADPLSQNQISKSTGWSVGQIFRILTVMERRGYIARDKQSGLYSPTLRMFKIAHQHDPISALVNLSRSPLRQLADEIDQSCNLGYRDGDAVLVVAQADGPADFGFHIKVGASFPVLGTPTGEIFLAFQNSDGSLSPDLDPALRRRLEDTRARGFVEVADHLHAGVIDVAFPILDRDGTALAALTVPYVSTSYSTRQIDVVRAAARRTAATLSTLLAGRISEETS